METFTLEIKDKENDPYVKLIRATLTVGEATQAPFTFDFIAKNREALVTLDANKIAQDAKNALESFNAGGGTNSNRKYADFAALPTPGLITKTDYFTYMGIAELSDVKLADSVDFLVTLNDTDFSFTFVATINVLHTSLSVQARTTASIKIFASDREALLNEVKLQALKAEMDGN